MLKLQNIKIEEVLQEMVSHLGSECFILRVSGFVVKKNDVRSYEVLCLSRKIISANLEIGCSKIQPVLPRNHEYFVIGMRRAYILIFFQMSQAGHRLYGHARNPQVFLTFDKVPDP